MRLWHYKVIPYLPKSQLLSQWRELNSVYKKEDNHILINYIYYYNKEYLLNYSNLVIKEMTKRGYKINKWENYINYFGAKDDEFFDEKLIFNEHDERYLTQCFYNLQEKYDRGQKDFSSQEYLRLEYMFFSKK